MEYKYEAALSYATEDQELVEKVYHYLRALGISVFWAPSAAGQIAFSGENQSEGFYRIFGIEARFAVLFVSKDYLARKNPMEEARIAFARHGEEGTVIPIYLDGTELPKELLDPDKVNYFKARDAAVIAEHLKNKIKASEEGEEKRNRNSENCNGFYVSNNQAEKQVFIQTLKGNINGI